jgi:diguanylate cyclase (GGDEF)-like protein
VEGRRIDRGLANARGDQLMRGAFETPGTGNGAMQALSRLLRVAAQATDALTVERAFVREARALFDVSAVVLLRVEDGTVVVAAGDPEPTGRVRLEDPSPVRRVLAEGVPVRLAGSAAGELIRAGRFAAEPDVVVLVPAGPPGDFGHVLVLADARGRALSEADVESAAAFASVAGASLAQTRLADEHAAQVARQSALARAAKALNESLDLTRVLPRICEEAALILDADRVAVYRGSASQGLVLEASNAPDDMVGRRVEAGAGLAGRSIASGQPAFTSDYQRDVQPSPEGPFHDIRSALAAPMRWDGELRGVLWVGFRSEHPVKQTDLNLLESFAELAAVACRNASVHAGLAEAARTDALTGCLNHAALHETLRRETQRSKRTGRELSVVLLDLDHFKQVNERHGHLVGDEVLRRVGMALRQAIRPYDFVARYGGDEFAIVAVDADETRAAEIAHRSLERIADAVADLGERAEGAAATAGVSQWSPEIAPIELVRLADRALLYGKQRGIRGSVVLGSMVPPDFLSGTSTAGERTEPAAQEAGPAPWPTAVRAETEPLRKQAHHLELANQLGARLAEMKDVDEIVNVTVDELHVAFGYPVAAVLRCRDAETLEVVSVRDGASGPLAAGRSLPAEAGIVGRAIRERKTVAGGAELAVPVWLGSELWGVIYIQETRGDVFSLDDIRVVETVADQLGSAVRSAILYEQLERAYLGTAEALGAALEAKDVPSPERARSIIQLAEAVGRRLGMDGDELRKLRYAAAFHDIGRIAVPESLLNKPGPLTDSEHEQLQKHTLMGEEILQPVGFLSDVLPLVRHGHERWDGEGYPDHLAGERIPLAARIILACDAYEAMTSDRPYRAAMSPEGVRRELRLHSGTQFDPAVVEALMAVLDSRGQPSGAPSAPGG